jgi:hypothetical protein
MSLLCAATPADVSHSGPDGPVPPLQYGCRAVPAHAQGEPALSAVLQYMYCGAVHLLCSTDAVLCLLMPKVSVALFSFFVCFSFPFHFFAYYVGIMFLF